MAKDGWFASDGSFRHRLLGGYVSDGTTRHRLRKLYVSTGNNTRELVFDLTRLKSLPLDNLTASATSVLESFESLSDTGLVTLHGSGGTDGLTLNDTREHPPAAPSDCTATTVDHDTIDVTWTDNSSNEDNFRLQRKNVDAGGSYSTIATPGANVESYTDDGLNSSTTYQYRVRAENTGGNSAYDESNQATTDEGVPAAPSSLSASITATCDWEVTLNWTDNSDNEDSFVIERRHDQTGSFGPWTEIDTVGANTTSYVDTAPVGDGGGSDTTNEYRVKARNTAGDSSASNTDSITTPGAPQAASNLTLTWSDGTGANPECGVSLSWTDNSTAECEFEIYRNSGLLTTVAANSESYFDGTANESTTYTYDVRAVNEWGSTGDATDSIETGTCEGGIE